MALTLVSCSKGTLRKGNWEKYNYSALSALIRENGNRSEGYGDRPRPYAVFDFDNTSIIGDIEVATLIYQLEHLELRIAPETLWNTLTDLYPDIDAPVAGLDGVSARMLATDVLNDYIFLFDKYISSSEMSLEQIRKTPQFLDFRAKTYALSAGSDALGYEAGCLWILKLFNGMTKDEVRALAEKAADDALSRRRLSREIWVSPDMGEAGRVEVGIIRGLGIAPEMTDLYGTLQENGIDVYICSASMKEVVEAVACNPKYGFNVPQDNVYGIRLKGSGIIRAAYDPAWVPTFKEGKVTCIRTSIAPHHGGRGPILAAGDSNGDYEMLTRFDDLKIGLIINCGNSGGIGELSETAASPAGRAEGITGTRYLLQGRDASKKKFVKSTESKKF